MRFRALIARPLLLLAAFGFALGLQAYLLVQQFIGKQESMSKLAKTDSCDEPAVPVAAQENPNKLLFISCGGFEE